MLRGEILCTTETPYALSAGRARPGELHLCSHSQHLPALRVNSLSPVSPMT